MIEFPQDVDLIHEHVCVPDKPLVDDLDDSIRVGRLFEFGAIDGAVTAPADGLCEGDCYFGIELVVLSDVFLPGLDEEIFLEGDFGRIGSIRRE